MPRFAAFPAPSRLSLSARARQPSAPAAPKRSGVRLACATLALLFGCGRAPVSFETRCHAELPKPQIVVNALPSAIEYDFSASVSNLTAASSPRGSHTWILGHTSAGLQHMVNIAGTSLTDPASGEACFSPLITVELNAGPQRVAVAREFPPGSCAFDEIVRHELRHVQTNQDAVEGTADELQRELQKAFGDRIWFGQPAQLQAWFNQEIESKWVPRLQQRLLAAERLHAEIDSPEEYARNRIICNGEIEAVLQRISAGRSPP